MPIIGFYALMWIGAYVTAAHVMQLNGYYR